jgi:hypothetical protein
VGDLEQALALVGLMLSALEQVVIIVTALRATEALRPTGRFKCISASPVGAKLRMECRQGQDWLELDSVH